jgi:hypothetical protein
MKRVIAALMMAVACSQPVTAQDAPPTIGDPWQEVAQPPTPLKHHVMLPIVAR